MALGLYLRIWILGRTPITSDQAAVGLMAREILHGHLFAFYWGQHYGGGEPYVVAALFSLLGQSRLALGSPQSSSTRLPHYSCGASVAGCSTLGPPRSRR